jgi:hypothetical protein
MKLTPDKFQEYCGLREMQHLSSSQTTDVPLDLEMHEEKMVWRIGVSYGNTVDPEGVWYWDTREAAEGVRKEALLRGGTELTPTVLQITVEQASEFARLIGATKVEIMNIDYDVVEWWLV